MGSDLDISIEVRHPNTPHRDPKHWSALFGGPSKALDRGIVVDAFGDSDPETLVGQKDGYLNHVEWTQRAEHPECPWRLDEPYWVRCIPGQEFVDIVVQKHWQKLQDGDYKDKECSAELRAFATIVKHMLVEGLDVRVWCWHSQ
jgi:hypothetical protein